MKFRWYAARKILISALAIVLIVLAGVWVAGDRPNKPDTKKTVATTSTKNTGSKTTPSTPSATTDTLTNTGPGEDIAVFVVTSLAASGLYYRYLLRRLNA